MEKQIFIDFLVVTLTTISRLKGIVRNDHKLYSKVEELINLIIEIIITMCEEYE